MPSGSLIFHQETETAIAARQGLILVVGPKAVTSDYLTQELALRVLRGEQVRQPDSQT